MFPVNNYLSKAGITTPATFESLPEQIFQLSAFSKAFGAKWLTSNHL
jgi:hypothetical protein